MTTHFDRERELQRRIERAAGEAFPGLDVLDVELDAPRETVRIFVDHPSGVSHELCSRVTRLVRDDLEQYALEVSSPGSARPLRHASHWRGAVGSQVRLRTRGGKRAMLATVVAVEDEDRLLLRRADGTEESIALGNVVRAHLVPGTGATADTPTTGKGSA